MKKLLLLFFALLTGVSGAWAQPVTVTIVDGTKNNPPYDTYGTRNINVNPNTLTTNAHSGLAGVVLSAPVIERATWWYIYCLGIKPSAVNNEETITFTAPEGYVIYTLSMQLQAISSNNPYEVIVAGKTKTITGSAAQTINEIVGKSSFSFTIKQTSETNNWLAVKALSLTLAKKVSASNVQQGKAYVIVPFAGDRGVMYASGGYLESCGGSAQSAKNTDIPADMTNTAQQFAFVSYNSRTYLYNVGTKTFAQTIDNGYVTMGKDAPVPFTLKDISEGDHAGYSQIWHQDTQMLNISTGWSHGVLANWNTSDSGNNFAILEAGDYTLDDAVNILKGPVTVTYNVVSEANGAIIETTTVTQYRGEEYALPSLLRRDYCTYELYTDAACTQPATVMASDLEGTTATVYAKYAASLPFEVSADFASAKWYYVQLRAKWLKYDTSISGVDDQVTDDSGQWAFIGNPYTGFQVINKKAGNGNFLTHSDAMLQFNQTATNWTVAQHPSTYINGFWIYELAGSKYYMPYAGSDGAVTALSNAAGLTASNDGGASQGGGAWVLTAVPDDYYALVEENITPFINQAADDVPFKISTNAAMALTSAITAAREDGMVSLDEYNELLNALNSSIKYPTTGYYRMKNYNNGGYAGATTSTAAIIANGAGVASTVLLLTKSAGSNTYTIQSQGQYFGVPEQYTDVALSNTKLTYTPAVETPGYASLKATGTGLYGYIGLDGSNNLEGAAATGISANPAAYWALESATDLSLALNGPVEGNYYATLCLPFAVTLDDAEAYTLTLNEGETALDMSDAITEVPAGTPVLVVGTSASATANIASKAEYVSAPLTSTSLTGTFVDKSVTAETDYFLGADEGNVGFYKWDGTTLKANRAYLEATKLTSGVKGFVLNWGGEDAIGSIAADAQSRKTIYNLAGQRVQKVQKGLYIVNGKKVVLK